MTQLECPDWMRYKRPPREADYRSAPIPTMRHVPFWICEIQEGALAATMPTNFFEDARGRLWLEGRSSTAHPVPQSTADVGDLVLVERVATGVRVLSWPEGRCIYHDVRDPNRYGLADLWVVQMPCASAR